MAESYLAIERENREGFAPFRYRLMGEAGNVVDEGDAPRMSDGRIPAIISFYSRAYAIDMAASADSSQAVVYAERTHIRLNKIEH